MYLFIISQHIQRWTATFRGVNWESFFVQEHPSSDAYRFTRKDQALRQLQDGDKVSVRACDRLFVRVVCVFCARFVRLCVCLSALGSAHTPSHAHTHAHRLLSEPCWTRVLLVAAPMRIVWLQQWQARSINARTHAHQHTREHKHSLRYTLMHALTHRRTHVLTRTRPHTLTAYTSSHTCSHTCAHIYADTHTYSYAHSRTRSYAEEDAYKKATRERTVRSLADQRHRYYQACDGMANDPTHAPH